MHRQQRGERFGSAIIRRGGAQEVEAVQIGSRHVDLRSGQLRGRRRCSRAVAPRSRRACVRWMTASALIEMIAPAGFDGLTHADIGCSPSSCKTRTNRREPAVRRGVVPVRHGSRRSTRGASSRGRPASGPARRACGPGSRGSGSGRGSSCARSGDRTCVATTWPRPRSRRGRRSP